MTSLIFFLFLGRSQPWSLFINRGAEPAKVGNQIPLSKFMSVGKAQRGGVLNIF